MHYIGSSVKHSPNKLILIFAHSMSCIRKVTSIINCGYARASIYENSNPGERGQRARQTIDTQSRMNSFRSQFNTYSEYGIPDDGYFDVGGKDRKRQFDRDCNKILEGFIKFRSDGESINSRKESYLQHFSVSQWSQLPNSEKKQHRLGNCTRCFELYDDLQSAFPLKPIYRPETVVSLDRNAMQQQGVKKFTSNVLLELNRVYENEASTSFTEALIKTKSAGVEKKKTQNEKRREKRHLQKEITYKVNEHFADTAAITLLTEGESKRKYHRKRLAQSFCSPQEQPRLKKKKHSPNFGNVSWDTDHMESTLRNWPTGTCINWRALGRAHGGNAGQVLLRNKGSMLNKSSIARQREKSQADCVRKNYLAATYRFLAIHPSMLSRLRLNP